MSKFKVGDKVQRRAPVDGKIMRGKVVKAVKNGASIDIDIELTEGVGHYVAGTIYRGCGSFWDVVEQPDDELPPVPDSVMYFNSVRDEDNDQRLVVQMTSSDSGKWSDEANAHVGLMVIPRTGSTLSRNAIGINLAPDAALQLAHDLRRMAMDIKRKEKADVL